MLSFAFISDEICADFSDAIQHGLSWGVTRYELRMLPTGRVPHVAATDFKAVRRAMKEHGIRITALSPGSFKLAPEDRDGIAAQLRETLPRTLDMALELGAPLVIVFGFMRSGKAGRACARRRRDAAGSGPRLRRRRRSRGGERAGLHLRLGIEHRRLHRRGRLPLPQGQLGSRECRGHGRAPLARGLRGAEAAYRQHPRQGHGGRIARALRAHRRRGGGLARTAPRGQ
ncbi:MAG: TIM barrel protein [Ignavibacteria bacterium]|nr:TIM barrel protein [Ignavibacteria bacterium]